MISYVIRGNELINKNYPEFHIYRDVSFYLKFVQNVDIRAFPPKASYTQMLVELKWNFEEGDDKKSLNIDDRAVIAAVE
jgi:hypothetical protein